MRTQVEGIILSKIPFKERDLICRLLLRNGNKVSILVYGGQSSGKRQLSSHLELGILIRAFLQRKRVTEGEQIHVAHDCTSLWRSKYIRSNHLAFFLSCLYLETLDKISLPELVPGLAQDQHQQEQHSSEFEGGFRVLSNGLFYLEESLKKNCFRPYTHIFLFFSKLLFEQGLVPNLSHCILCEGPLNPPLGFVHHLGGFSCSTCAPPISSSTGTGSGFVATTILKNLLSIRQIKYQEFESLSDLSAEAAEELFLYFCYQCHLDKGKFKSIKYLHPSASS